MLLVAPKGDRIRPAASTFNKYFLDEILGLYNFKSRTILFSLFYLAPDN